MEMKIRLKAVCVDLQIKDIWQELLELYLLDDDHILSQSVHYKGNDELYIPIDTMISIPIKNIQSVIYTKTRMQ